VPAMTQSLIHYDRSTGSLTGANLWERLVAVALIAGSKVSSLFYHRGYNACANLLRKTVPDRDIALRLNRDAVFTFPFSDGYWSKFLNRAFLYEAELDLLLKDNAQADYTLLDCGANYGYWSVLVSSKTYGSHRAIAIEPSSGNLRILSNNATVNGGRFQVLHAAIGRARGKARLSGTKHEAFSIAGSQDESGEEVTVLALDNLIDDGLIAATGKYVVKLDVEGVETAALAGGTHLAQTDAIFYCEEHGNDPHHTVSRFILNETPLTLVVFDPAARQFKTLRDLSPLDAIKADTHVGYNVFATASPFWLERIAVLNTRLAGSN